MNIRPIPAAHGVGFFSMERLPQFAGKYREEQVGRYWNYYVTPKCWAWPYAALSASGVNNPQQYVIDGFSPNLNKSLHVGHLRQLALANSLNKILGYNGQPKVTFVSLLGASQGVYQYAVDELDGWFKFINYSPVLYYDILMPKDQDIVVRRKVLKPDANGNETEVEVWDGPKGEVIVTRSDGRSTYAFHDIAFARVVKPTHYITGVEQKEHFESLGFGDKHLGMGLVLGSDGKKMKSRSGDSVSAKEVLEQIIDNLDPTENPKKVAWNVAAWNFLHVARGKNVKFVPEEWTKPEAPGMYITYTYARVKSALYVQKGERPLFVDEEDQTITQADADLMGFADQYKWAVQRSVDGLDPAILANFAHDLAAKLGVAYHAEKIKGVDTASAQQSQPL